MIGQDTLLALLRGLHMAATLSFLGTAGFILWVLPAAGNGQAGLLPRLIRLCRVSGIAAMVLLAAWFVLQSAAIADASSFGDLTAALPVIAQRTRYGNIISWRLGLLLIATVLVSRSRARLHVTFALTVAALGLQGLIGHAGAMAGDVGAVIVASEALHLTAAGLWLGSLMPLWLCLRALPAPDAAAVCVRFSPIGLGCVMMLAGTGLAQGVELIGGLPALFDTRYGHLALVKIALFLVALMLAAFNRLRLTDRLAAGQGDARHRLRVSVCVEMLIGLAIITIAALLASSPPAMRHASNRPGDRGGWVTRANAPESGSAASG